MDEYKTKLLDYISKQTTKQMKIPAMGFSGHPLPNENEETCQNVTKPNSASNSVDENEECLDQDVLKCIDINYFLTTDGLQLIELKNVLNEKPANLHTVEERKRQLDMQYKVLSKQVLERILEARPSCNAQLNVIVETQKQLEESIWTCQKARSYLKYAKTNLTTLSLEILAQYRKRELLIDLLQILKAIKKIKSTESEVQTLLSQHNYSEAINALLESKTYASMFFEYNCVQSLHKKLNDTLLAIEFNLDAVIEDMVFNFDMIKYAKIQEAFKLLNKSLYAMDQLHINFISAIHSSVNLVVRKHITAELDDNQKFLYEQLCEQVPIDKYITCLLSLCKTVWIIIASYNQIVNWHHNYKLYAVDMPDSPDLDIEEKLRKGQSRVWNDIIAKICLLLQSSKIRNLKYDQFIQVLSIVARLQKIGIQFCGENSENLMETLQTQSEIFLHSYRLSCLEEVCLFLDNESWASIDSFTNIFELPEFRHLCNMQNQKNSLPLAASTGDSLSNKNEELNSVYSRSGESSVNDAFNYFLRFSEKSSPFDGGLDISMLEEDILSGILDEKASCYYSEDSEDEQFNLSTEKYNKSANNNDLIVNNTTLNILRCIARYIQICQLLPFLSPKIVTWCIELLDFYAFAIFEIFCKDSTVQMNKLYTSKLDLKFQAVKDTILKDCKFWSPNLTSLKNNELANPETLYGLPERINAVESGNCLVSQFAILKSYLIHWLPKNEKKTIRNFLQNMNFMEDLSCIVFTCVTSRVIDLQSILSMIMKVKWDLNEVSFHHNNYVDVMNRNIQHFAMRLEEIGKEVSVPTEVLWNSMAHVAAHLLVEGYSHIKKCSAGGRALMQLDFANFMSILELISKQTYPKYRVFVEEFIKSYYLSPEQFEEWITTQKTKEQYSTQQLENLVLCVCASDRRLRQKLLSLLENVHDNNDSK